jgi:hypothetical protein
MPGKAPIILNIKEKSKKIVNKEATLRLKETNNNTIAVG